MTAHRARFGTVHWIRFPAIVTPDQLPLSTLPEQCLSWKIGPDGPVGPNGYRLPSNIWCGVALFGERSAAETAYATKELYVPSLSNAVESWHALLLPVTHRGECNHLERDRPGLIFDVESDDPGGPLFVMTTAGFNFGPDFDVARAVDFRINVDKVQEWLQSIDGRVASQVFTPHTVGDDGVTMSFWRSDEDMISTMYKSGIHRTQIERYKREKTADRTSFTRCRLLKTSGTWAGSDPLERAQNHS